MNVEEKKMNIAQVATGDADLRSGEIPSIDLYLDQIISLISDKNRDASECYSERNLTKMMVNNYAKGGLIDPPNGKKYSKAHIVQMLLVNRLKSSLSMSEIKQMLDGVKEESADVIALYDGFLDEKESLHDTAGAIIEKITEDGEGAGAVLSLLALSEYLRNAAKLIINEKYPVREEIKEKDKEKDKDKDKEKNKKENKKKVEQ